MSDSTNLPTSNSDKNITQLDNILQNYFNEFVINVRKIILLFNDITPTPETEKFQKVFSGLKWDKIISRYYLRLDKHKEELCERNVKMFESVIIAFPEIDISVRWNKLGSGSENENNKEKIWTLLQKLYVSSFFLVEGSSKDMIDETKMKLIKKIETDINKRDIAFNPFSGINITNKPEQLSMDDLSKGKLPDKPTGSTSRAGMLTSLLGVDKMIDIKSLREQLKKIDEKEINDATNSIASLLGDSIDKNLVTEMITSVSNELKQKVEESDNPIDSIINVAESVAKKMAPKMDPKKINIDKLMESSKNFAKNCKDKDGKPIFAGTGGTDPFSLLSGMLGKLTIDQKTGKPSQLSEQDCLKQCEKMIGEISSKTNGKCSNIDLNKILNTLTSQHNNDDKDDKDDKIIDSKTTKKKHHAHNHTHKHKHKHDGEKKSSDKI